MAESIKKRRKAEALELAYVVYDIFKESQNDSATLKNGQNNANHNEGKD